MRGERLWMRGEGLWMRGGRLLGKDERRGPKKPSSQSYGYYSVYSSCVQSYNKKIIISIFATHYFVHSALKETIFSKDKRNLLIR